MCLNHTKFIRPSIQSTQLVLKRRWMDGSLSVRRDINLFEDRMDASPHHLCACMHRYGNSRYG